MIAFDHLSYWYPRTGVPALDDISLDIASGSYTLLAGPSGGGKSTLLRAINGLVPQFYGGRMSGGTRVAGLDPARTPSRRMATIAGMVFQEPEAQSVADTVEDEIAFGMEQQGVDPVQMHRRLDSLLEALGIDRLRHRTVATLSGGERQRVAIAAVLALEPRILVLDEPTSQLDPLGAAAVLDAVQSLLATRELTVLISEHRLERLLTAVTDVIEVSTGRARMLAPRAAARELAAVPPVCELARRLAFDEMPLTVGEASRLLAARYGRLGPRPSAVETAASGDELLSVHSLSVNYGEFPALSNVSLNLRESEVVALVGPNGSGKSTFFRALAGLVSPASGEIRFAGKAAPPSVQSRTAFAGLVPQDPALALYHESVHEEIEETLRLRKRDRRLVASQLDAWNLAPFASLNPRDLSVGQQQRVAIGAMLAHEPCAWLLDEPTRGADAQAKRWLAARLRAHSAAGGAAIVSTHDIEFAATCATRVIGLEGGRLMFDLPRDEAFAATGPLPTQIARLVPGAIVVEDVAL